MENTTRLTRRCFLHALCLGVPALGLAAAGAGCAGKPTNNPDTWYIDHQKAIIDENKKTFDFVRPLLVEPYGEQEAGAIYAETFEIFAALLPKLPYIGGGSNDLTANLTSATAALAFYQVMKARGAQEVEIGRILYQGVQRQFAADPLASSMGRLANSKLAQDKIKQEAEVSHKRTYPADWVFDFVPGDSQNDFGVDYTECGIVKYYQEQGAEAFAPYLCLLDFPISLALNTGLVRTQTLARGGACCDFRYKTGRVISPEWDPGYIIGGK